MTRDLIKLFNREKNPFITYGFTILITLFTTLIHSLLPFGSQSPYLLALIPLILSTIFGGKGPGLLALLFKIFIINFFFIPPLGTFKIDSFILEQTFIYLAEGFLIIWLTRRNRI